VWALGAELGEGPAWSVGGGALWFVDIKKRHMHRYVPGEQGGRTWDMPDQPGFALPISGRGLVVGMPGGLHRFDPVSGQLQQLVAIEPDRPGNRLNDAHVDAAGRLWFGSMDDAEKEPTAARCTTPTL
jgi:sugar lactone lactonase YvrE